MSSLPPSPNEKSWRPTQGKKGFAELVLNCGTFLGRTIYIHYTDYAGFTSICRNNRIERGRSNTWRPGSRPGIYLCPSTQTFSPQNVFELIFLGNERYRHRGDYVVIFGHAGLRYTDNYVTEGSLVRELFVEEDIAIESGAIYYAGRNLFKNVFDGQGSHPIKKWSR